MGSIPVTACCPKKPRIESMNMMLAETSRIEGDCGDFEDLGVQSMRLGEELFDRIIEKKSYSEKDA